MEEVVLGKDELSIESVVAAARHGAPVRLNDAARVRVAKARELIDVWIAEGKVIYGVTTGFGSLCNQTISAENARRLQTNLLMSHAAGVGKPLAGEIVRAMMAVRIQDLALGHSGVRFETLDALVDLLNSGLVPVVPEQGSVGASGDLAPMAHLALVLIGEGEAFLDGRRLPGGEALAAAGLKPIRLEAGEGIALTNGTQAMTAIMALAVHDALNLSKTADIACAMSLEVLMGTNTEFDPRIHRLRPHPGQAAAADNMFRITEGSEIISSHRDCSRIQDAYTLRCSPQVHGASKDALDHVKTVTLTEINSSTTNPLIFPEEDDFLLGGNFHGQPIALAADYLALALAELANISERRIERLVNPQLSGLPAFLIAESGLNSGFMIAQYTAAALVSENKSLAHPASVDSIPTSANKEDHVSMGTIAARKCRAILENTERVIAIELLCAAQAMDLLTQGRPGAGTEEAYRAVREIVPVMKEDRVLYRDIEAVIELVKGGELVERVEKVVGLLK